MIAVEHQIHDIGGGESASNTTTNL